MQADRRVSWDEASLARQRQEAGVSYGTQKIDDGPLTPYIYYSESISRADGTVATTLAGDGAAPARISISELQERLSVTADRQAQASTTTAPPDSEEDDEEVPVPRSRLTMAKDCATMHAEDAVRSRSRLVGYASMADGDKQAAKEPSGGGRWLPGAAQFALALCGCYALDWAMHNRYCGFLFRCGCTFPWAGGVSACNIHNPAGPKCPWCNVHNASLSWLAPAITGNFNVALMVLSYCAVWGAQLPAPPSRALAVRAAAAVAAFLGWGFVMGLVFWRFDGTHYPCFLLWGRETECQLPV